MVVEVNAERLAVGADVEGVSKGYSGSRSLREMKRSASKGARCIITPL